MSQSVTESVWIVIPAYQAVARVGGVVSGVIGQGGRVIVVDDGSTDGTGEAAERAGAEVLRHAANRGKGAALQTGFLAALQRGATAVVTLDADGQHDPLEIPRLLAAQRATPGSMVIGVRRFDPAIMPRWSRIGNTISTFFISRFAGRRYQDTQSGYRVYPAGLLRRVALKTRHFETETELLLWAGKLGVPICEVAIQTIYHEPRRYALRDREDPGQPRATHFRIRQDTWRVIRLVAMSPWWTVPEGGAEVAPCQQPKMEAT